jgi:hypothetical protein
VVADHVGGFSNSYGICLEVLVCWLSGKTHELQSNEAFDAGGTVFGCGLLLNSKNELAVFFTHNGILMGKFKLLLTENKFKTKKIQKNFYNLSFDNVFLNITGKHPITPTVNRLYPTVVTWRTDMEANFGGNLVEKPFKYDIDKCEGLVFE